MRSVPTASSYLMRGSAAYRRATLAVFCAGFATFALLYCVLPLLAALAVLFVAVGGSARKL